MMCASVVEQTDIENTKVPDLPACETTFIVRVLFVCLAGFADRLLSASSSSLIGLIRQIENGVRGPPQPL